jgi:uncharacterized protein involved in tolerance to divalent cations
MLQEMQIVFKAAEEKITEATNLIKEFGIIRVPAIADAETFFICVSAFPYLGLAVVF